MKKKTEKDKMLAGELYCAMDEELVKEHIRAQQLLAEFNNSLGEDKSELLKSLFGKVGDNFSIKPTFHCDYGSNIYVGENFFVNYDCIIVKLL